jgi:hypothetical protein
LPAVAGTAYFKSIGQVGRSVDLQTSPWRTFAMSHSPAARRLTRTTSRFLLVPVTHGLGFT